MSTRTVRLDNDAERVLQEVISSTDLTISAAFKQGLIALRDRLAVEAKSTPWEIYERLDLGEGGWAIAPSTDTSRATRETIRSKLGR